MSWSVNSFGKPAAIKKALEQQFANAKNGTAHIPEEQSVVIAVEAIVNAQLDFFIHRNPDAVVRVTASGSASIAPENASWKDALSSSYAFEQVYGFVE